MIIKRFFGKTIEAAIKSAKQMYGDNYKVFESSDDGDEKAGITVVVDKHKDQQNQLYTRQGNKREKSYAEEQVTFEKSHHSTGIDEEQIMPELKELRQIAKEKKKSKQSAKKDDIVFKQILSNSNEAFSEQRAQTESNHKKQMNVYGRDAIRSGRHNSTLAEKRVSTPSKPRSYRPSLTSQAAQSRSSNMQDEGTSKKVQQGLNGSTVSKQDSGGNNLLTLFDQTGPKLRNPAPSSVMDEPISRYNEREIKVLHKRFDKIEALLDSNLISSNIGYISHPVFQQLVQTGISISIVSGWFSQIISEGIDPADQTKLFMSKLSEIIKEVLTVNSTLEPLKYQLFTGPSGSGKTELIMKLLLNPDYMAGRKTAVISVIPTPDTDKHYYTILKPFCTDHEIPYYEISAGSEVNKYLEEWGDFDFVLIDSPSLQTEKADSFKQYWKVRQLLAPLTPLEVHYVVNVSKTRSSIHSPASIHHPLQPDYIALTHLDELTQWGTIIPFFLEMEASIRYISTGKRTPDSLESFKPAWFAQKLLQDS